MGMKGTPNACTFSSSIVIPASSADQEIPLELQQAEKRFPEDPPFFSLHTSRAPFLLIPIETRR